jgi:serine/threonine-protein kinase
MKFTLPNIKRIAYWFSISFGILLVLFLIVDNIVLPMYVQRDNVTVIPDVVGMKLNDAVEVLKAQHLKPIQADLKNDLKYPIGAVCAQNPPPGSTVKYGRGIYLSISGGDPKVIVPAIIGKSIRDANFALERFRLKAGEIQYQTSSEVPENVVISQSITQGALVAAGSRIDLVISLGNTADKVPVPSIVRKSLTEATEILTKAGLKVGIMTQQESKNLLPNTVIDQFPRAGELVAKGRAVDLFVSIKAEQSTTREN